MTLLWFLVQCGYQVSFTFFCFLRSTGRLWHTSGVPLVEQLIIAEPNTNRVRYRYNLVFEAAKIHLPIIVFINRQQGAQKGGRTHNNTPTRSPRLQLTDKRPKQQQRRQAPQRQHAFHSSTAPTNSNEPGTKATTP